MAMPAFRSPVSLHPIGFGQLAAPPVAQGNASRSSRPAASFAASPPIRLRCGASSTMASTSLCSISTSTCLRSPHRRVRKLADRHVKEICRAIRRFDAVNLQLEYGTLGRYGRDIYRRFCWLTAAAPRLSVTFHTLLDAAEFRGQRLFEGAGDGQAEDRRPHAGRLHSDASPVLRDRPPAALDAVHQAGQRDRSQPAGRLRRKVPLWHQQCLRPSAVLSRACRGRRHPQHRLAAAISRCSTICRPTRR